MCLGGRRSVYVCVGERSAYVCEEGLCIWHHGGLGECGGSDLLVMCSISCAVSGCLLSFLLKSLAFCHSVRFA